MIQCRKSWKVDKLNEMEMVLNMAGNNVTQKKMLTETDIARIAAREALKVYMEENKKHDPVAEKERDKVKNTKRILSSYRRAKAKLQEEVEFSEDEKMDLRWRFVEDLMGSARSIVNRSEMSIISDEKRRKEDAYLIRCIERAVEMYEKECQEIGSEEVKRRFRELRMMYLEEKIYTVQQIAEAENISEKTVYKDIGIACRVLAVYLLGI